MRASPDSGLNRTNGPAVQFFSELNCYLAVNFDPVHVFVRIKMNIFRGNVSNVSAKSATLQSGSTRSQRSPACRLSARFFVLYVLTVLVERGERERCLVLDATTGGLANTENRAVSIIAKENVFETMIDNYQAGNRTGSRV